MLIAAKFGSSAETDAYFIAITATILFTTIINESINTTIIPILSDVEAAKGEAEKKYQTNNILNILLLLSLVITFLAWVTAPAIVKILATGFNGEQFDLAVSLTRIGLPAIFFSSVLGVFRGFLQSDLKFTESAASNLPFNIVYICFLIFFSSIFGIKGMMVTSVVATAAQIIVLIPGMRKAGYRYRFVLKFKDEYVDKIVKLIPPVLISVAMINLNKIVDRTMASTLADGSISALSYASTIDRLTTSLFIAAIVTVIYPILSKEANKATYDGLKKVITFGINIILIITVPATIGMIILAGPIVKVAYQRGAFDAADAYMTVGALVFYSVGLVGTALKPMLNRVYYSLQDTKTPMMNGIISVVINIILNLILIRFMAVNGLALATSIAVTVTSLLQLYGLRKKIGPFGLYKSIQCGIKSLAAAAVMGGIVYFLYDILDKSFSGGTIVQLLTLFVTVGAGGLVYFALIYLFKVEEMNWFINMVKSKISRK